MRDLIKYNPVNWVDGMKINKSHFIAQDNAVTDALQQVASLGLSPNRFGLLPPSVAGEENYNIKVSVDNQRRVRVSLPYCQAITQGGVRISIPAFGNSLKQADQYPVIDFDLSAQSSETAWWIVLLIHPFEKLAAGEPDLNENPPRLSFLVPSYTVEMVSPSQYNQYTSNPYALTIGKVIVNGNDIRADEEYIPPCLTIAAHEDLKSLLQEIDRFMGNLESRCSLIVQKIFKKSQQNELSELVQYLCDRMMMFLGPAVIQLRWQMLHQSPDYLFASLASLARTMKNTIDLRIGSGREEMMNYLCEWCELNQGELETMLSSVAGMRYNHNDVNASIPQIVQFVKVTDRLFDTLSKMEFIGKRKDSGIFVKEEKSDPSDAAKSRRRFFG
jgi:hypothetical protein